MHNFRSHFFLWNKWLFVTHVHYAIWWRQGKDERMNECTHCKWNMYVCISIVAHAFGRSITHSYGSARERKVLVEKEKQDIIFVSPSSLSRVPDTLDVV